MRITNQMMSNTSLTNINKGKTYLDKLNTQLTLEKKITRPSDDPIIAIRALRLRSNLNEVTQYYEKNVPDAQAWIKATEGAITSTRDIITDMQAEFTSGSNGDLTANDRKKILEGLKSLRDQVYDNGNADYAGRSVFTGYRTSTKLTFQENTAQAYEDITEGFNASDIENKTYVSGKLDATADVANADSNATKQATSVETNQVVRIRLAYDDLDTTTANDLTYRTEVALTNSAASRTGNTITINEGFSAPVTVTYNPATDTYSGAGVTVEKNDDGSLRVTQSMAAVPPAAAYNNVVNVTTSGKATTAYREDTMAVTLMSQSDAAYAPGDNQVILIPETGELIFGANRAATLKNLGDIQGVSTIEYKYDKSDWKQDDLRPEHYFDCVDTSGATPINYVDHNQEISYNVSFNQDARVNTFADEVFTHDINRDVDEMMSAIEDVNAAENKVKQLEAMQKDTTYTAAEQTNIASCLEAAKKEQDLADAKMQSMFENGITKMQGYLDQANLANTNCGSRDARLEMVYNRLKDQKSTFYELASENENVDVTEIAVEISSAELTYNAALLATGKIAQQSLLNYL